MTYNVFAATRRAAISTLIATAMVSQLLEPGFAATSIDTWKVDLAQSHFGPVSSTLYLYPGSEKATTQAAETTGNSKASTLVVIHDGKIYLAKDENPSSGKAVDYSGWKDMKLLQIGDHVQPVRCGFYVGCRSGQSDNRIILRFATAKGIDVSEQMSTAVVINAR